MFHTTNTMRMALLLCAVLFSCSSPNSQSNFNPDTGRHVANWLPAGHMNAASNDTSGCVECHGGALDGGISNIACMSCHLGGPTAVHPASWVPVFSTHGSYVNSAPTGTAACANQYCHGTSLAGVTGSGPSCTSCHSLPYDPATVTCGACHRIPPDGTVAPNIAGRHAVHTAITGTSQASCAVCHNGSDGVTGTGAHYNGSVEVSFLAAYNAKSGTAAFGTNTCSNVSCHGGKTTPSWLTGSIDVNTQCTSCHAYGTAQYNSFNSGEHDLHVNSEGFFCTECHDTAKLAAVHFNDLNTTAMTQAYQTLLNALNYTGTGGGTFGTCTINCHGENHSRRSW